jgi:hypothetical protein
MRLTTCIEMGPRDALEVISALVVSPTKFQLPVNGFDPELFPGLLLFLQATENKRQNAIAKKGDRFNMATVFVSG